MSGDLTTVFGQLSLFLILNIRNQQAQEMNKILILSYNYLFMLIRDRVSERAFQEMILKWQTLKKSRKEGLRKPSTPCNPCVIQITLGLPCRHILYKKIQKDEPIQPEEIHELWFWQEPVERPDSDYVLPPLDPLIVKGKGRPKGALGREKDKRTRRDPSSHEYVEALETAEAAQDRKRQKQQPPPSAATNQTRSNQINQIK